MIVQELIRFSIIVGFGTDTGEDDGQRDNLQRLSEKDRREEPTDNGCEPLSGLLIAEFDAAGDDEENRNSDENDAQTIGNEDTPPRQHLRRFCLRFSRR